MAIIKNNPTFNRRTNESVINNPNAGLGYHSRTLFTYQAVGGINLAVTDPAEWCNSATGDGIQMFIDNSYGTIHGDAILPGKYWCPGKTIRIKGTLIARAELSADQGPAYFNLRFGLKELQNNAVTILAMQNEDNNHIFAPTPQVATVYPYTSVAFCQVITCTEIDTGNANPIKFSSYGYYEYLWGDENTAITGLDFTYVPVWKQTRFNLAVNSDYYNYNTRIIINGFGTTTGGVDLYEVLLPTLTIEELA